MRKHSPKQHPVWVVRDMEQYPEGLCGDMGGDCMNCLLPQNMRRECLIAQDEEKEKVADRKKLEDQIMWNEGGSGFGLCSVANAKSWAMDAPGPDKPDLISIVSLGTPKEKYTDFELEKIISFSKKTTDDYDRMFRYRRGANLIMLDKQGEEGKEFAWLRKRLSWEFGSMHSPTLDEAIKIMGRKVGERFKIPMITKQIRLKDGFRYVQRCFDCPCINRDVHADPWYRCTLGTSLPNKSLIDIMPPEECLLEDYDA